MATEHPGGGTFRVGTSGYHYPHWRGVLYPEDAPEEEWFGLYADRFDTVEINNTFYQLPDAGTVEGWRRRAPEGFLYSVKFSRYGTHLKHLKDPGEVIPNFLGVVEALEDRLGPVLVQLPPNWNAAPDRLARFLEVAPDGLRWAVEVRDPDWLRPDVYGVLRAAGAALCIHDKIEDHPREITAEWTYLRYHGDEYAGSYSHQKLTAEAERIADRLAAGIDVYAYFNNDVGGHAVSNAMDLGRYVASRCG